MLTQYMQAALRRAKYEILPDDKTYDGEIPGLRGVWANAKTLEACREELQSVLADWMLFRLSMGDKLPVVDRINLTRKFKKQAA
jgi:predicted RNase H-like HicB family nuclease